MRVCQCIMKSIPGILMTSTTTLIFVTYIWVFCKYFKFYSYHGKIITQKYHANTVNLKKMVTSSFEIDKSDHDIGSYLIELFSQKQ